MDTKKTRVALLKVPVPQRIPDINKITALGSNTGNLVFWESLHRLFAPDFISYSETDLLTSYDKVILTDLIWIRENVDFDYLEPIINKHKIPFIPISVGLQSSNFNSDFILHPNLVKLLQNLQERAVLGVRGTYTAEILNKYGIRNISIIGCPSMYYWNNPNLKIEGTPKNGIASCNFRTFYGSLKTYEKHFLSYCATNKMQFVEQTEHKLKLEHTNDKKYFEYVNNWLSKHTEMFYDHISWSQGLNDITFSFGGRFHGNVIALHNNIKALFLTSDSRTQELTNFFNLPTLPIQKFDGTKPLEYYFNLADYSKFNNNYASIYENFANFVAQNELQFSENATPLSFEIGKKRVPSTSTALITDDIIQKMSMLDEKKQKLLLKYLEVLFNL